MSWEATAYVKKLQKCPDGATLNRGQKGLLMILADYHHPTKRITWPSVRTLAEESLASEAQTRRDLHYFVDHCLLELLRPERQGRLMMNAYMFLELDSPERLDALLASKGPQFEPLFCPEKRVAEGAQPNGKRLAEGAHSNGQRVAEGAHPPGPNKERAVSSEHRASGAESKRAREEMAWHEDRDLRRFTDELRRVYGGSVGSHASDDELRQKAAANAGIPWHRVRGLLEKSARIEAQQ